MLTFTVAAYSLYVLMSLRLTVWVGQTLFTNGRVFLVDTFCGNTEVADAVNSLLLVGFYLINVGFISLFLRAAEKPNSVEATMELLSSKMGVVMLTLGTMHLFNVGVFTWMRCKSVGPANRAATQPCAKAEGC